MVLLTQYPTLDKAMIVKGMLQSYGIDCKVSSDAASSIFPAPDAGTGVSRIYVEQSQLDKARELLSTHGD